jgi:hypothetical protein
LVSNRCSEQVQPQKLHFSASLRYVEINSSGHS